MSDHDAQEASASVPRPPRENLFRAQPVIELVRSEGAAMPTLAGHFAVTNQWTRINSLYEGEFMERFAPGSFKKTIRESKDTMRVLFQHGRDPQIGERVLGPIEKLTEDDVGARYEVPLLNTDYNRELIPGLERGLYGASFRFAVMKEEFVQKPKRSSYNPDGLPERTVTEAQVKEFGPVTFPAYGGATAGLRSISDELILGRMLEDPDRLLELIELAKNGAPGLRPELIEQARIRAEPVAQEATTQTDEKPDPPVGTTPRASSTTPAVELYTTTRKEKPSWLL